MASEEARFTTNREVLKLNMSDGMNDLKNDRDAVIIRVCDLSRYLAKIVEFQ
jgi:hypothetical protein